MLPAILVLLCFDDAPLIPDATALMKEVEQHQLKMDEIRENYTYHRIRRTEELDGKSEVKKVITQEREIFFVNGHQVGRLVKKDGNPLTDSEEKSEQERVRKLGENFAKKPVTFGKGGGVNIINLILPVAETSNPLRIQWKGRPTLQFDFKGDQKAEAHSIESKAARKLEGKIWIDEADRQVARLEVEFYEPFRIAGGLLASIQKGTVIKIDQAPIGEGLWMPDESEEHMNMRVVTKGVRQHVSIKSFDFKRFNVDAVAGEPARK